jgi:hypothetical protein
MLSVMSSRTTWSWGGREKNKETPAIQLMRVDDGGNKFPNRRRLAGHIYPNTR